jgi:hypothetical protein
MKLTQVFHKDGNANFTVSFSNGAILSLPYSDYERLDGIINSNYSYCGHVYADHTRVYEALLPYAIIG